MSTTLLFAVVASAIGLGGFLLFVLIRRKAEERDRRDDAERRAAEAAERRAEEARKYAEWRDRRREAQLLSRSLTEGEARLLLPMAGWTTEMMAQFTAPDLVVEARYTLGWEGIDADAPSRAEIDKIKKRIGR